MSDNIEVFCTKCGCLIENDDFYNNLLDETVCSNCIDDNISISMDDPKLEIFLGNLYEFGYVEGFNILGEGEGRIVYDIENSFYLPLICKYPKKNREDGVNYQCFVENYIYDNSSEEQLKNDFLAKVYTPSNLVKSNNCTFMEKCNVFDECFFDRIDIRDSDIFNKIIDLKDKTINYTNLDKIIEDAIEESLSNEGVYVSSIGNYDTLFRVYKFFTLCNFIDGIYEYASENDIGIDSSELIDYIKEEIPFYIPQEFILLQNRFNFSYYDISRGNQWGVSMIDGKVKLVDFGMGINSKDFYLSNKNS